jgi:hypothetical protein
LGIVFGLIYIGVPSISGAVLGKTIQIIPIPFVDFTHYTEHILPATPIMLSFDLGLVVTGMVMPFNAMIGILFGVLFTMLANPLLHKVGVLNSWEPGLNALEVVRSNYFDFYFSFHLGLMFASTLVYVTLAYFLVNYGSGPLAGDPFPLWLLLFYGFVWTPFVSYMSTRMEGLVGMQLTVPFVRESTFILSGYKGAAIWYAPIPLHNYANQVVEFRTMELTGTKFTSLIKAEMITYPLMIISTLVFAQFIWSMGPVPSEMYPYANQFWELQAYQQGLVATATLPNAGVSPFMEAFHYIYIAAGLGSALGLYAILANFNLPVFLVYGMVRGLDQTLPHSAIPTVIGALIGRYGCRKWFGDMWPQYRIVFAAGFGAGMGLSVMLALGIVFMFKSVNVTLPL